MSEPERNTKQVPQQSQCWRLFVTQAMSLHQVTAPIPLCSPYTGGLIRPRDSTRTAFPPAVHCGDAPLPYTQTFYKFISVLYLLAKPALKLSFMRAEELSHLCISWASPSKCWRMLEYILVGYLLELVGTSCILVGIKAGRK